MYSDSATVSEDAFSLASGTTASFSSAADTALFAPASADDAVHAVPSLLSQLLSGRTDEQVCRLLCRQAAKLTSGCNRRLSAWRSKCCTYLTRSRMSTCSRPH